MEEWGNIQLVFFFATNIHVAHCSHTPIMKLCIESEIQVEDCIISIVGKKYSMEKNASVIQSYVRLSGKYLNKKRPVTGFYTVNPADTLNGHFY